MGMGPPFTAPMQPDEPLAVIGDLHGCHDAFQRLLEKLSAEAGDDLRLITVGDYIDRGEDSQAVLAHLQRENTAGQMTCLIGNHEELMLDFLDDPERNGLRWLRNGGLQTLASFGVGRVTESSKGALLIDARDALRDAMGPMEEWLRALPDRFQSGNIAVVHAGADPAVAIADQDRKHLVWGHRQFHQHNRADGVWVVHGHTTVPVVEAHQGRIGVDTGAYATGRLSAGVFYPSGRFEVIDVGRSF